jgi:non-ribosomal peptide synthase protein (TIGR01720 family)
VPAAAHVQINDLLLTALARSFARWMGSRRLLIDLEGHGREEISDEIDVTRTVGWFTAIFPVVLDLGATTDVGSALQSISAQLRQIPGRGLSYGLLRYLGSDTEVALSLRRSPQPEVIFNYLGQFENNDDTASTSGLRLAGENPGLLQDPRQQRRYLLEVGGSVTGGQLHFTIKYSENIHRRYTIQQLAGGLLQALRDLIEHYTLSSGDLEEVVVEDFPAIGLSQETIDKALAELDLA